MPPSWGGAKRWGTDCRVEQAERPSEILRFESYTDTDAGSTTINQRLNFRTHVKKTHRSHVVTRSGAARIHFNAPFSQGRPCPRTPGPGSSF